jgi:hypothetical protein
VELIARGGGVTENNRTVVAAVVGAVAGGMAGYMLFTERGRELRRRLEPAIEDFARELAQLRGTVNRAMGVANEGWHVLNEALGERGEAGGGFTTPRQTNPF